MSERSVPAAVPSKPLAERRTGLIDTSARLPVEPAEPVAERTAGEPRFARLATPYVRGKRRNRVGYAIFALLVVVPTLLAAAYYGVIATNQYQSEIRLGVRSSDAQRNDGSGIFSGMASASQIGLQSNIVVEYIQSREIVDAINQKIDLRKAFAAPAIDPISRLKADASIEDLVDYWRGKVEPYFDLTTGVISVRVRAFTPGEAQVIGTEIVRLSELLVNDLSRRARDDFVRFAQDQVTGADQRLRRARNAILEFRNQEQVIDPKKEVDASLALVAKLKEEHDKASIELLSARPFFSEDSPRIISIRSRMAALQERIRDAESKLTSQDGANGRRPLSKDIRGYEELETERHLAEKYYESALEALQRARFEAARQTMYLEVFVKPAISERPSHPRRVVAVLISALIAFGAWLFVMMSYYSVREHI